MKRIYFVQTVLFLVIIFFGNFLVAQPPCSNYSDWNGSTIYHSGDRVNYAGTVYSNRYDWNTSAQAPINCECCSKWCMGGHQWYEEGGCTIATLPVELINFKAIKKGKEVFLEWETLSEINNDYFLLYKSSDGMNWRSISKTVGGGNLITPKKYLEVDLKGCTGLCYYRLVQVDFDGTTKTYDDIVFNYSDRNKFGFYLEVSPNPTYENAHINFIVPQSGRVKFEFFNELGQSVLCNSKLAKKGENNFTVNSSMLMEGMYILRLHDSQGYSQVVRLVKK
jgi:hypothetical protein